MTRLVSLLRRHPLAHVPRLRVSPHPHMEDAAAGTGKVYRYETHRPWLAVLGAVAIAGGLVTIANILTGLVG